jgi:methionyl aminopeptidase
VVEIDKKTAEKYIKAGQILAEVQKKAGKTIKPGQKLLEIAENIEKEIVALVGKGAGPAFPVNLSLNNDAAHYTPSVNDEKTLGEKDVLKVDIGVHVDGYIADAAFTLDFSQEHGKMVEAAERALEEALSIAKEGIELGSIGSKIQDTINSYGFNPIQNLSGHGLTRWDAHAAPTISNIAKKDERVLEEGMVVAIEPFATDGKGFVKESAQSEIFQLDEPKPVRNMDARRIVELVAENYHTLPFAERWVEKELKLGEFRRKVAMRELMQRKCISAFPILREESGKIVTQAENSILLFEGKVKRLV